MGGHGARLDCRMVRRTRPRLAHVVATCRSSGGDWWPIPDRRFVCYDRIRERSGSLPRSLPRRPLAVPMARGRFVPLTVPHRCHASALLTAGEVERMIYPAPSAEAPRDRLARAWCPPRRRAGGTSLPGGRLAIGGLSDALPPAGPRLSPLPPPPPCSGRRAARRPRGAGPRPAPDLAWALGRCRPGPSAGSTSMRRAPGVGSSSFPPRTVPT